MDPPFALPRSLILHVYVSYVALHCPLTTWALPRQQSVGILALQAKHCGSYDFLLTNLLRLCSKALLARWYCERLARNMWEAAIRLVFLGRLVECAVPGVAWWCTIWRLWKVIAWWPLSNEVITYCKSAVTAVNMNSSCRQSMTFSLDKARSVGEWQSSWFWSFWAYRWRYLRRELAERQSPRQRPGVHVTVSGQQRCPGGRRNSTEAITWFLWDVDRFRSLATWISTSTSP